MTKAEKLTLPAERTIHIEVDPLQCFCGKDGAWANDPNVGIPDMTQLLEHPAIAEQNIRRWNGVKQLIVQSRYHVGQFMIPTPHLHTMLHGDENPNRKILLPEEVIAMGDTVQKNKNSVFSSPQVLKAIEQSFGHLAITSQSKLTSTLQQRVLGEDREDSRLYVVLHGVTGSSCIQTSTIDAFIPLMIDLRINYKIVCARDSIASRNSRKSAHESLLHMLARDDNHAAIVVPAGENIEMV